MIGTAGATIIAVINLTFAALLGIAVGGLLSILFRQPFTLIVAAIDAAFAVVMFVAAAYTWPLFGFNQGIWISPPTLDFVFTAVGVVACHALRLRVKR